ncbi:hypothetical protein GUJ93_ZPchr0005g14712 [Zizania palustris]|uniref:Uncharacterized protein n=1 Tax=Zizania palustris TaxID=103762 RepID=A0A8J5SBE3_ZIZPA|nr:hypothetical protein GUJ93_ZPchr0005g14712 [Zizania palustris]
MQCRCPLMCKVSFRIQAPCVAALATVKLPSLRAPDACALSRAQKRRGAAARLLETQAESCACRGLWGLLLERAGQPAAARAQRLRPPRA